MLQRSVLFLAICTLFAHGALAQYENGLGLSACRGILHEHKGQVSCEEGSDGTIILRVELPAVPLPGPKTNDVTVPVLWRSQPSV